jgi:hypothetical protein
MWVWVVANLTVTATRSHRWYALRFGEQFTKLGRAILIPYIY